MAGDNVIQVTDSDFEAHVLKSNVPCLVDFWAPWCGPCKAIGPMIEDLADQYAEKIKVAKMNVDDNPSSPSKYKIRAIPALILFHKGEIVDQVTGAVGKAQLESMFNKAL